MARIPPRRVAADDRKRLQDLEADLKAKIYGQDAAVARVAQAIKMNRAGLGQPERPIGCFLFAGPTGVGKTELAKQLAEILGVAFLRFDMSEYMERHTVSRLIGAPPGYVGFDQGGLLTDAIHQTPHAVLLLDEIEKAHQDLFNLLLQVMDHGVADRQQRAQVRLPPRRPDHDQQRRRARAVAAHAGLRRRRATIGSATPTRRSSGCSRPSSATGWTPRSTSRRSIRR